MSTDQSVHQSTTFYGGLINSRLINDPVNYTFIGIFQVTADFRRRSVLLSVREDRKQGLTGAISVRQGRWIDYNFKI